MSRYKKEIELIEKAFDLNSNSPMTYEDIRKILFYLTDNVFLLVLSDMFYEGIITEDKGMYQLPANLYASKIENANKKKQAIIDANKRISLIRDEFNGSFYDFDDAWNKYKHILNNNDKSLFLYDMKSLGYIACDSFFIFNFKSINDYLLYELNQLDIIDIHSVRCKYEPLIRKIDLNHLLEKLKKTYQIIEFEKEVYINIKQLNNSNIYISDILDYCSKVWDFCKNGYCFSIKSLRSNGFMHHLDNLGMEDLFYESLLKYDKRFFTYKMTNCYVFSTEKKPSISKITFELVKQHRSINIYDLQKILRDQFGIITQFVSDNGALVNQSVILDDNEELFYSKELGKLYFDKSLYYKEIEYDE